VPLVIGHRGASAQATENTLAAFNAARESGADGVELDARLCASGEVVVFHDDDLRRLVARGERIAALPLDRLRALPLPGGHMMPTLDEVLEEVGVDLLVNVELKSTRESSVRLVQSVVRLVRRHAAAERVLVSCFDPAVLAQVRVRAPRLAVGYLFHSKQPAPLRRAWVAPLLRPFSLHPEHMLATEPAVSAWKRAGYRIAAWTVDDAREARRLAGLGVDAIISNDPAAVRAALTAPLP
jgi:glycerophosphoryl diester phosphodiesterase